jgi:glutamate-1-semialdehyde 2,1-aminomutase
MTMVAGRVTMQLFDEPAIERLNRLGDYARQRIAESIRESGAPASVTGAGSLFRIHLQPEPPVDYRTAFADPAQSANVTWLVNYLMDRGFLMINTCTGALSTPMTEKEVDQLASALYDGLNQLKQRL